MNPIFAFAVFYLISVRTPIPCGNSVHGSSNVSFSCYQTNGESHFVVFRDQQKAERFVANLEPYNHFGPLGKTVPNNKRFIWGMVVHTFVKTHDKWIEVNKHEVAEYRREPSSAQDFKND